MPTSSRLNWQKNGQFVNRPYQDNKEIFVYMKATGVVRRIEEYGIIGQKLKKPHKQ